MTKLKTKLYHFNCVFEGVNMPKKTRKDISHRENGFEIVRIDERIQNKNDHY